MRMKSLHYCLLSMVVITLNACATISINHNMPNNAEEKSTSYSLQEHLGNKNTGNILLVLNFSGGGSRAAALAYGVLLELRDTTIYINGEPRRLLDEVDLISSVSGGSFTAAYYGLNGEKTFSQFESDFLRKDIQGELVNSMIQPSQWVSDKGRTDMVIDYYQQHLFNNATFGDLQKGNGPMVLISATDLSSGARVSFIQEYFNFICSDINQFPIADAVAASSAVPFIFDPLVVRNFSYEQCVTQQLEHLGSVLNRLDDLKNPELILAANNLKKIFEQKDSFQYLHLVDGGITDNLGLRSLIEMVELSGGIRNFLDSMQIKPVNRSAIIVVDASTDPTYEMAKKSEPPSMTEIAKAVSDIQLHRYNASTKSLMQRTLEQWNNQLSDEGIHLQKTDYIEVNLREISAIQKQSLINQIPTSLSLTDAQVDALIAAGRDLLRHNITFQALVHQYDRYLPQ
ncbi:MAG: patatin-like phospholipase family protein [Zetaproteobacteria bacterium]|nr:patatin-like phospholipase family protein [Zetaproteobacteria bacterium]